MEASLASLSLQEEAATPFTSLPPELLLDIASHLAGSLARFSLVSRFVRDAVQPQLYRKVDLWCDGAPEDKYRRKESIRTTLKLLAKDSARCGLVQGLDLRDWGWMEESEFNCLRRIVKRAPNLKVLQLANRAEGSKAYVPHFPPFWHAVQQSQSVTKLSCVLGPVIDGVHLELLGHLRRFQCCAYKIEPHVDGSLPPLTHLYLDSVVDYTEEWFSPKLFDSLEMLGLVALETVGVNVVLSSLETYLAGKRSPRLKTLILEVCIYTGLGNPPQVSPQLFEQLLASFGLLRSIEQLEIRSAPDWNGEPDTARTLKVLQLISDNFSDIQHLVLSLSSFVPHVTLLTALPQIARALRKFPRLLSFATDITTVQLPETPVEALIRSLRGHVLAPSLSPEMEAALYFAGSGSRHPTLHRVTIPSRLFDTELDQDREDCFAVFARRDEDTVEISARRGHWKTTTLQAQSRGTRAQVGLWD